MVILFGPLFQSQCQFYFSHVRRTHMHACMHIHEYNYTLTYTQEHTQLIKIFQLVGYIDATCILLIRAHLFSHTHTHTHTHTHSKVHTSQSKLYPRVTFTSFYSNHDTLISLKYTQYSHNTLNIILVDKNTQKIIAVHTDNPQWYSSHHRQQTWTMYWVGWRCGLFILTNLLQPQVVKPIAMYFTHIV